MYETSSRPAGAAAQPNPLLRAQVIIAGPGRRTMMSRRVAKANRGPAVVLISIITWLNKQLPILNANAKERLYWDIMVMSLVLYNAVVVPFDAGFHVTTGNGITVLEHVIDVVFGIDMLLAFRTAYIDAQGNLIRDPKEIANHYLRTWFPIDIVAVFPFEVLITIATNGKSTNLKIFAIMRTPRLLRLGKMMRFFERLKNANIIHMVALLLLMVMIAHWICCAWFIIFAYTKGSVHAWSFDAMVGHDVLTQYFQALYNSFLLMIGNDVAPKNNIEKAFCSVVLVLGACFYAIVVGNMSLLVTSMNITTARHNQKKEIITETVRYLGSPPNLMERVDEYFDYLITFSHPGPDGMTLLNDLPKSLAADISQHMYLQAVKQVPLFSSCEEGFIKVLVSRLRVMVCLPGEVIFRIGDVGHEMYFITKGKIAVLNRNLETMAVLAEGDYFGELGLLATARRTAMCVALSNCDLTVMTASDLQHSMKDYPVSAQHVRGQAAQRLAELQTGGNIANNMGEHHAPRHLKVLNPAAAREVEAQAAIRASMDDQNRAGRRDSETGPQWISSRVKASIIAADPDMLATASGTPSHVAGGKVRRASCSSTSNWRATCSTTTSPRPQGSSPSPVPRNPDSPHQSTSAGLWPSLQQSEATPSPRALAASRLSRRTGSGIDMSTVEAVNAESKRAAYVSRRTSSFCMPLARTDSSMFRTTNTSHPAAAQFMRRASVKLSDKLADQIKRAVEDDKAQQEAAAPSAPDPQHMELLVRIVQTAQHLSSKVEHMESRVKGLDARLKMVAANREGLMGGGSSSYAQPAGLDIDKWGMM